MMIAGPKMRAVDRTVGSQHEKNGGDKNLVGDGIEHTAQRRLLAPAPCEIAVEEIGDRRADE